MSKKQTPKEQIKLILRAIDIPGLVIEVTYKNVKYGPKQYKELRQLLISELEVIETTQL